MAQKITVTLEDDLDGGPADQTVRFGLDGAEYEIDLSARNASAFREQLAPYTERARKASRALTENSPFAPAFSRSTTSALKTSLAKRDRREIFFSMNLRSAKLTSMS